MVAFSIYAFVLSGIYVVYYTYVIFMDVYGDKLKSQSSDSEIISVGGEGDHQSVIINETESGYTTGPASPPQDAPSSDNNLNSTEAPPPEPVSATDNAPVPLAVTLSQAEQIQAKYDSSAEEINPRWEKEFGSAEFAETLASSYDDNSGIVLTRTLK